MKRVPLPRAQRLRAHAASLVLLAFGATCASAQDLVQEARNAEASGDLRGAEELYTRALTEVGGDWRLHLLRGGVRFRLGRVAPSLEDFDAVARLRPQIEPELWQRGISQYYVGQFAECRRQFEVHRTVNAADVENAAWHFLCVAATEGADAAREAILPVGTDRRPSLAEIYELYRGAMTPEEVLAAPWSESNDARLQSIGEFYARLYIGLWHEAHGRADLARREITRADELGFASYMGDVARVHLEQRRIDD